jgi:hypothetical protein
MNVAVQSDVAVQLVSVDAVQDVADADVAVLMEEQLSKNKFMNFFCFLE